MTALYRQDVFANNLANLDTVGFKADIPSIQARPDVRTEDGLGHLPSNALLEKLGGGTFLRPNRINLEQGSLRRTGVMLDVAVEGRGFLVVEDSSDSTNPQRLTRDGRLLRSPAGELVMAGTGLPVLDTNNQRITIPATGELRIDGDGTISVNNRAIARMKFIDVPEGTQLRKAGHSMMFAPPEVFSSNLRPLGNLRQQMLEESAVDELRALMNVTGASREVDANIDAMRAHDRLMDRAITSLGRPIA